MTAPTCDVRGKPATIHDTTVSSGNTATRHLCPEHGADTWLGAAARCDRRLPAVLSALEDLGRLAEERRRAGGP